MQVARYRARFDWLAELGGALALGLAGGFAALKAGPALGFAGPIAMMSGGFFGLAAGLLAMRAVGSDPRAHALADFDVEPIRPEEVLDLTEVAEEPLLLDTPFEEPADDFLLLEDALAEARPESRVVQLFAAKPMPTAGQLKDRIDRHLATGTMHVVREYEGPAPDASDALFAALSELKRSLR